MAFLFRRKSKRKSRTKSATKNQDQNQDQNQHQNQGQIIKKLLESSRKGRWCQVISILLKYPQLVNVQTKYSKYAILHQAAWWNAPQCVIKIIYVVNGDLLLRSKEGTPLEIAIMRDSYDIKNLVQEMETLIEEGYMHIPAVINMVGLIVIIWNREIYYLW